jgi:hypothetical protein
LKKLILALTVCALVMLPMAAMAVTYDFFAITANQPDCLTGASQFKVDVSEVNTSVLFKFYNTGPNLSFMGQIYFYENAGSTLLDYGNVSITNGTGVKFVEGNLNQGNPNLPGIKNYLNNNNITPNYFAEADSPGSGKDGVDPGEYVEFTIPRNGSFEDVITALNYGPNFPSGGILLGVHGQGLHPGGNSCSYVQTPTVPIPGSLLLLGSGLLGLIGIRRKLS